MTINTEELGAAQAAAQEPVQEVLEATKTHPELPLPVPQKIAAVRAIGGPVLAIRPTNLEEVWRLATAAVRGGFAPKGMNIEACVNAIVMGSEVGIPAMSALQSIAVINGRPALFGDGALGVVRASGRLEYIRETFSEKHMQARCTVKRTGEQAISRAFSQKDAEQAGLWGKVGKYGDPTPWVTYPKRMLAMRARSWALRDGFADLLKGFAIAEEVQDIVDLQATKEEPVPVLGK